MVKKSANTAFNSKRFNSSKWLLLLCAASAAAVDLAVIIMLFVGGTGGGYLACPFIMLIFDLAFIAISQFFTNFRFKYSLAVWIGYVVFSAIALAVGTALLLGGNGSVITNASFWLWAVVHIFGLLCAALTALHASRIIKNMWIMLAFAVVFVFGCVSYCAYMADAGFFGQGLKSRPIVFKYNSSTGEYSASDVLPGRSDRVDIPLTFNGKPVTSLSFNLLLNSGIKEYTFENDLALTDNYALERSARLDGKTIKVGKDAVNTMRDKLYAYKGNGNTQANAVALANATIPSTLGAGEGYVAFTYGVQEFNACGGKVIPVYIGDLEKFDFEEYTTGYDYITNRDKNNAEHLDWAFKNGGYILSDIMGENGSVLGGDIKQSTVASVELEKVYRVTVESGNDKKYDLHEKQPELCFDTVGGNRLDYRYVTLDKAQTLIDGLTPRKGFAVEWAYYDDRGKRVLDDLKEVLENLDGSDVTISTVWRLNNPTVTLSADNDGKYVYGDNVKITTDASIEAEGVPLEYDWIYADSSIIGWTTKDLQFTHPKPDRSGVYKLIVHNGESEVTSLGAVASVEIEIEISKKPVQFVWEAPAAEDLVYDGLGKSVVVSFDETQIVSDDEFKYAVMLTTGVDATVSGNTYTCVKANTYNVRMSIWGDDINCYDVGDTNTYTFTVAKRPVHVEWSNYDNLVYSGLPQGPAASAMGVGSDGELISSVTGNNTNAVTNAKATANINNSNYVLENPTQTYSIARKELYITPSEVTAVYGSAPSANEVTLNFEGFVNGETQSVLGSMRRITFTPALDSEDYEAKTFTEGVSVSGYTSTNYDIKYLNSAYTVVPRTVELLWSGYNGLVYNANAKNVTAAVKNAYNNDSVGVTVEGGNEVNASDTAYVATAVALTGNKASNYTLPQNATHEYTIARAQLKIIPDSKSSVYGEPLKQLTASVQGINYNGEVEYELIKEDGNTVGTYAISVSLKADYGNYNIDCEQTATYEITSRTAIVEWQLPEDLVYDGTEKTVTAVVANAVEGDDVRVVVDGGTRMGAGIYTATAFGLLGRNVSNYTLPEGISIRFIIAKRTVTVRWELPSSLSYDGTIKTVTAYYDGVIEEDKLSVQITGNTAQEVGKYIAILTIDGVQGANYTIKNATCHYEIEPAEIEAGPGAPVGGD